MSLGKIEHRLLRDHDVMKKPGLLCPDEIKQLRTLNEGSLGATSVNPRRRPSTSGPESSRRPLTMSSIRICPRFCSQCFGSSPPSASSELQATVSWATVIHLFVRNNFDTP